jgi:serine O-acetyltransferase
MNGDSRTHSFRKAASADFKRYAMQEKTTYLWAFETLLRNQGLQAVLVYRFGRKLKTSDKHALKLPLLGIGWLLYLPLAWLIRACYGIELSLSADIGAGFVVGHFGGIVVVNCRIGERCSMGQQTKIGSKLEAAAGPQIGDGVWIGPYTKIFGPAHIGDGATIAPGACVTKDVPGKALVVGNPGRIIFRSYDNRHIMSPGVVTSKVESGTR